ncbi:MAG: hypothetical protein QXQ31_07245 [Zestosphaera sp.]|uniref:hypothetical protein n=1 Tax=Metallosphaera sp. TaxID=2020860 RepID=UPI0031782BB9
MNKDDLYAVVESIATALGLPFPAPMVRFYISTLSEDKLKKINEILRKYCD